MPRGHHTTHRGVPTPEGGARKRRVTVRLNDREHATVTRAADAAGVDLAAYLRRAGLDCAATPKKEPSE
jgi:hypothetical protein